jgi:TolA-binding protein
LASNEKESEPSQAVERDVKEMSLVPKDSGKKSSFFDIFSSGASVQNDKLQEEQDLKMAKLWSRVDDLSSEQSRLRERLKVIEKGLTLGLIPEELKEKNVAHGNVGGSHNFLKEQEKTSHEAQHAPEIVEENPERSEKKSHESGFEKDHQITENDYQKALAMAHEQFRSGAYGRAIVEYESIGKKFGESFVGGSHKFWIARCWINMKEYGTARQILAEFLKDYPGSTWAPRAKLELARVEWKLGLRETSLSRLRDVIRDHPQEDAAEMAKMELSTLDKTL